MAIISGVDQPLVSVIVPVRDGARFLGAALESIFAQTHPALDVVVVDDGSQDATGDVARAFPAARYVARPASGLAATRNAGLAEARGELISFLDHDDLWPAHKTAAQVAALAADPGAAFAVAHLENFLEPGCARPEWLKPDALGVPQLAYSTGTLLARRSMFDVLGTFDTSYTVGDDTDWFARAQAAGMRAVVLPEVLLRRRVHDRNHTTETLGECAPTVMRLLKAKLDRARRAGR